MGRGVREERGVERQITSRRSRDDNRLPAIAGQVLDEFERALDAREAQRRKVVCEDKDFGHHASGDGQRSGSAR